ncbi:Hypothetical_protein [Hexamita inflata]|uniref:Hypothetical_protein n=1 Tax=Hexamita inflata TaxID=28002 RepID=A0AA86U4I3_9EUKA|nr:Hypothetical protein HINF_LOCUS29850 [Hexamita inflata]
MKMLQFNHMRTLINWRDWGEPVLQSVDMLLNVIFYGTIFSHSQFEEILKSSKKVRPGENCKIFNENYIYNLRESVKNLIFDISSAHLAQTCLQAPYFPLSENKYRT